jgi:hypothetical protein
MENRFNENLVLVSLECNEPVITAFETLIPGVARVVRQPLSRGHRNEFGAGLAPAFGRYFVIDGEYNWKYTDDTFDFSVLANTTITHAFCQSATSECWRTPPSSQLCAVR